MYRGDGYIVITHQELSSPSPNPSPLIPTQKPIQNQKGIIGTEADSRISLNQKSHFLKYPSQKATSTYYIEIQGHD